MQQKHNKSIIIAGLSLGILTSLIFWAKAVQAENSGDRPVPTIEDCVEKTGRSKDECKEMMEKFKRGLMRKDPGPGMKKNSNEREENKSFKESDGQRNKLGFAGAGVKLEMTERMKEEKRESLGRIADRVEKIIEFLESENINTDEIESNLASFKSKIEDVMSAYDVYIEVLESGSEGESEMLEISDEAKEAREKVRNLLAETLEFYRDTLREGIKAQIEKIND
ncbi:MAG: hypothetical protein A2288_01175 [Candidatus Moranbacteria bacterium RIFOXYA12_FULL_44_15]|nr:MAG: hypothetical protein A2288_01175 [Candidatus Moranbacteria bacterium RIFOXYA12_FULL_44_15]OGI36234.1 MAG: hypothetical protein A2259_02310 [Candidatus Moranbacteria bacterium RIFOXYA2_FULL_43_15]